MKTNVSIAVAPRLYSRIAPAVLLTLCSLLTLNACQKTPEPEAVAENNVQITPVTTSVEDSSKDATIDPINEANAGAMTAEAQSNNNAQQDNDLSVEDINPNPEQAIKGAQVTDVRYRSAAGDTLTVVFETSAAGVLNAIVTLPNKPKMTLSAPEGQGNNPTYRSADGSVELVSHGGGSTIDLIQNKTVTSFDAISADAEVITST